MVGVAESAREVFDRAFREHIRPALRGLGFRGAYPAFRLPDGRTWRQLGVQQSRGNHRGRSEFTVNLSVVARAAWDAAHDGPPDPNREYPPEDGVRVTRIGEVMPGGTDHWWLVTPGTDPDELGRSVVAAITDHAVPALRAS